MPRCASSGHVEMAKKKCSVAGCERSHDARGYCKRHYMRLRSHGDPLAGAAIRGHVQDYYNRVVLNYEGDDCLIWPFFRDKNGYGKMGRNGEVHLVTRCVCEDVHGPAPTERHQAAHSCGKGHTGCVTKKHLRWALPKENEADKLLHGTDNRGERSGLSVLTEEHVSEILALEGILSSVKIAEKYGVSAGAVGHIFAGKSWAWLLTNRNETVATFRNRGTDHGMAKLTEEDVRKIRILAKSHPPEWIADQFAVSKSHVVRIIKRQNWKHLD